VFVCVRVPGYPCKWACTWQHVMSGLAITEMVVVATCTVPEFEQPAPLSAACCCCRNPPAGPHSSPTPCRSMPFIMKSRGLSRAVGMSQLLDTSPDIKVPACCCCVYMRVCALVYMCVWGHMVA
jgi:hypothetical protein